MKQLIAVLIAVASIAAAQSPTKANLGQIGATAPAARVMVYVPGVGLLLAQIDPSIVLDTSGPVPVLKSIAPASGSIRTPEVFDISTVIQVAFTLQRVPKNLRVYRNGFLMQPPIVSGSGVTVTSAPDYNLAGSTVTFTPAQSPLPGDKIVFDYE